MDQHPTLSAAAIIAALRLQPHPEGGWYVETFRDTGGGVRGHSTAIYYLLERGDRSHWHRVRDATEVWHHYGGAPMTLKLSADGETVETIKLGPDILNGERPQCIVPADCWQSAISGGAWTLVGCTVAPGFDFSAFEMAQVDWAPGKA